MASVSYYRREAERCRKLATNTPNADMADRWRALAADYDKLAEVLEAQETMPPQPPQRMSMQQQPMQQQQAKSEPEDET
jgi:hypothetical protein